VFFDLRIAIRRLRKDLGFTLTAVLALALGIGASTIVFSLFDNLLIAPYPYKDAGRLVTFAIHNLTNQGSSVGRGSYSPQEFQAIQSRNHVFDDVIGAGVTARALYSDGSSTRVVREAFVTTNTFDFYGVSPLMGRAIEPGDGVPGAPPVFVMNYREWQTQFGADPAALGRSFVFNGEPRTLVGIMPPRFQANAAAIWVPADLAGVTDLPGGMLGIVGRLKPGVSLSASAADMDTLIHQLIQSEPGFVLNPAQYSVVVTPFVDGALGQFKTVLYALLAASLMLLGIACTNVANLLLARATAREREMAVCAALGASRGRLIRQLLTESLVLSAVACALGCAFAAGGLHVVSATIPQNTIPDEAVIALNMPVLWAAIGIAALTSIVCGLAPALHVVAANLQGRLSSGVKGAGGGARHGRLRSGLVVAEVGLSLVLLVGAGLTLRSFFTLTHVDLPFDPSRTIYARLALPRDRYYSKPDRKPAFFAEVLPRIKALPGVLDATESLMLPPNEGAWTDIAIPGRPHTDRWTADMELCTEGYFRTLGIQLVSGRLLSKDDVQGGRYVIVVNRTLARTYFGNDNPIGQTIKFEVLDRPFIDGPHNTFFEIVGVVADFKTRPDRREYAFHPTAYLPASVAGFGEPVHVLVKTAADPRTLTPAVSRAVWAVDPRIGVTASGSLEDFLAQEFRAPAFDFIAIGAFGGVGLILVAIGVFSVTAYTVSLQTYDIGVRLALGAEPKDILRMMFGKGAVLITLGTAIGVAASLALTRLIAQLLWGVSATDPWTFAAAIAVMVAVGSAACLLPARRAARVDPLVVMRAE
jgi:putative ABC transport system permease protein